MCLTINFCFLKKGYCQTKSLVSSVGNIMREVLNSSEMISPSDAVKNENATEEERKILIDKIRKEFGIEVKEENGLKFTVEQLSTIYTVLSNMPKELTEGLKVIKGTTDSGLFYPKIFGGSASGEYVPFTCEVHLNLESLGRNINYFKQVFSHEIAHHIDYKFYNGTAFLTAHLLSFKDEDYAYGYGKVNSLEDFATTMEMYMADSERELARAIQQAEKGNDIYLKKIMFVMSILAKDSNYSYLYKNQQIVKKVEISKGLNGQIRGINGVIIRNLWGIVDVEALKKLVANDFLITGVFRTTDRIISGIGRIAEGLKDGIGRIIHLDIVGGLKTIGKGFVNGVKEIAEGIKDGVNKVVNSVVKKVAEVGVVVLNKASKVVETVSSTFNNIKDGTKNLINKVGNFFKKLF